MSCPQEPSQRRAVTLPRLPQHPAHRLVNQIVLVMEKDVGDSERVAQLTSPDEILRRDNGNATLPQVRRPGQSPKRRATPILQIAANDRGSGRVHQIPVVDELRVIEIEAINPPALGVVGVLEGVHQQEQREQALFVNSGSQQRSDVR